MSLDRQNNDILNLSNNNIVIGQQHLNSDLFDGNLNPYLEDLLPEPLDSTDSLNRPNNKDMQLLISIRKHENDLKVAENLDHNLSLPLLFPMMPPSAYNRNSLGVPQSVIDNRLGVKILSSPTIAAFNLDPVRTSAFDLSQFLCNFTLLLVQNNIIECIYIDKNIKT
jgi:hypothetical protein